jgi:hypothetical protein
MKSATYKIDWNALNNALSRAVLEKGLLDEILDDLGCRWRRGPGWGSSRTACPVHEGDGQNMQVDTNGHDLPIRWCCYSNRCHEEYKPSLLGLVRGVLSQREGGKARMRDAVDYLTRFVGNVPVPRTMSRPDPEPMSGPELLDLTREQVRGPLTIPSPYFIGRGFSPAVLDAFDVGDSKKLRRAVVPLYDDEGTTCIGYVARSKRPECGRCGSNHDGPDCQYGQPKWTMPRGFPSSTYLYNYAAAKASDAPFIFLVEGAPDVFRVAEAGYVGVALLGSDASDGQLRKLAGLGKEVWIAFDNDEAGKAAEERFWRKKIASGVSLPTRNFTTPEPYKDLGDTPSAELGRAIRIQVEEIAAEYARYAEPPYDEVRWFEPGEARALSEDLLRAHEQWLRRAPSYA